MIEWPDGTVGNVPVENVRFLLGDNANQEA